MNRSQDPSNTSTALRPFCLPFPTQTLFHHSSTHPALHFWFFGGGASPGSALPLLDCSPSEVFWMLADPGIHPSSGLVVMATLARVSVCAWRAASIPGCHGQHRPQPQPRARPVTPGGGRDVLRCPRARLSAIFSLPAAPFRPPQPLRAARGSVPNRWRQGKAKTPLSPP